MCIPDTQAYKSKKDPSLPGGWREKNKSFDTRVDWIVAIAKKQRIFFVSHMGDVVEVNRQSQWDFASKGMGKLDGVVPYGICPGNHDQQRNTERVGDTSLFAAAFPPSRGGGNTRDRRDDADNRLVPERRGVVRAVGVQVDEADRPRQHLTEWLRV